MPSKARHIGNRRDRGGAFLYCGVRNTANYDYYMESEKEKIEEKADLISEKLLEDDLELETSLDNLPV